MPTELQITWEGSAPGLAEGRLSVGTFGEPLRLLLAAIRRIATNLVKEALEDSETCCFSDEARQLDIEITELLKGSAGFCSIITFASAPSGQSPFLTSLPEEAGMCLLEAIDSERRGVLRDGSVRKYLKSIPEGVLSQSYSLHNNGKHLKGISFGSMDIASRPTELPCIRQYVGTVIGVGFEPGNPEVRIRTDRSTVSLFATPKQIESALTLRDAVVKAVVVSQGAREGLLMIQELNKPINKGFRDIDIYCRWDELLKRLAL